MEIQIKHFLRPVLTISDENGNGYGYGNGNGYGNGYGYGNGNGYGNGYGYGYGYGNGSGNGDGDGYGNGSGNGDGKGILTLNKKVIYLIDNVQTILTSVKDDCAKGFILNKDLTLEKCYIVRNDYNFSHGKTLKEAIKSLEEKMLLKISISKRIESFKQSFKDYNKKVKSSILYDWHFKLTGSCKFGRDNFCKEHNINLSKDKFNIYEFVKLTKNSYGSEIIKKLLNEKEIS